jgi:nucleoside-diphosphate-sugar epimerase
MMMTSDRPNLPDVFLPEARAGFVGKTVIVTGATGFIGRRLVVALLDLGAKVSVILRSGHGAKALKGQGVSVWTGALSYPSFVETALKENEILFHLAYDVRASGRDNMSAFSTLNSAIQASDLERVVHMSSMVVYDHWPDGVIDQKAAATRTGREDYRDTKIEMEEALLAGVKPVAILQPGIVYGPGSAMWTDAPREALRRGPVILPDPIGLCPAIHVDDVVQATLRAALVSDLAHERFILNGPGKPTWGDFFKVHISAIGEGAIEYRALDELEARLPPVNEPSSASASPSMAARVSQVLRHVMGRSLFEAIVRAVTSRLASKGPIIPDRERLRLYSAKPDISDTYARKRLGYEPTFKLND